MSLDLRPAVLDDLGLLAALEWHCARYTVQTGVRVEFSASGLKGRRLAAQVETAAFRIVQEALTNVARHAGVNQVAVSAQAGDEKLLVRISDRGRGFDPRAALEARASNGVAGMVERALLLGGQLDLQSAPGAGTAIMAEPPLDNGK
jgi:signal transduction histidine kinase